MPSWLRYVERSRFNRLLSKLTCCKLKTDVGKISYNVTLIGIDDQPTGSCEQAIYSFTASTGS